MQCRWLTSHGQVCLLHMRFHGGSCAWLLKPLFASARGNRNDGRSQQSRHQGCLRTCAGVCKQLLQPRPCRAQRDRLLCGELRHAEAGYQAGGKLGVLHRQLEGLPEPLRQVCIAGLQVSRLTPTL